MAEESTIKEKSSSSNIYIWIAGAILLLVVGWFGFKVLLSPFENYKVTLVDAPKEIATGVNATFTWRVDGSSTTINHTAVHIGTVSNPAELGKEVAPADTSYTEMVKDFASGNFTVPLQFVGNHVITTPGTYYFRVHAAVKDKNYWSDEYTVVVTQGETDYKISLFSPPAETVTKSIVTFTWRVDGPPTTINHTAIHYGRTSTPGVLGKEITPDDTQYNLLTQDFASGNYGVPLQFIANTNIATVGAYFYRAHAVINGENYWTDEQELEVKRSTETTTPTTVSESTPSAE